MEIPVCFVDTSFWIASYRRHDQYRSCKGVAKMVKGKSHQAGHNGSRIVGVAKWNVGHRDSARSSQWLQLLSQ